MQTSSVVFLSSVELFSAVSGPVMHWGKQSCLCDGVCTHAGYYCQLIARPGWMASVLSLEHSLFSLMSRTQSSLQPIAKRVFVYWRRSNVRNHWGYEYRWEQYQCCSLNNFCGCLHVGINKQKSLWSIDDFQSRGSSDPKVPFLTSVPGNAFSSFHESRAMIWCQHVPEEDLC